jgi:hypothetical protein
MLRIRRAIAAFALGLALAMATGAMAQSTAGPQQVPAQTNSSPQVTQPDQGGVNWSGVGYGAGTVGANLFYVPAKVLYGVLGGITGGAGYLLTGGNSQTSDTIWRSSLGGDYVLTPDMIKGKEPIHFSGPTETEPSADASTNSNIGGATSAAGAGATGSGTLMGNAAPVSPAVSASTITAAPTDSTPHQMDRGAGPIKPPNGPSTSPGPVEPLPNTTIE